MVIGVEHPQYQKLETYRIAQPSLTTIQLKTDNLKARLSTQNKEQHWESSTSSTMIATSESFQSDTHRSTSDSRPKTERKLNL